MKQLSFSKQFWKQLIPVGNFLAVGSLAHRGHYFDLSLDGEATATNLVDIFVINS